MYTLEQIKNAVEASWDADTAYPDGTWSPERPARAQCVVTALVVQRYLGGDLEKLTSEYKGKPESHYRNILPSGGVVDLTRSQYPSEQSLQPSIVNLHGHKDVRDKMIHEPETLARYELLLSRVMQRLEEI